MASVSYCLILRIAFVKVIVVRKPLKIIKKEQSFGSKSQPFFPDLSRFFLFHLAIFHGFSWLFWDPSYPWVPPGSPLGPPWVLCETNKVLQRRIVRELRLQRLELTKFHLQWPGTHCQTMVIYGTTWDNTTWNEEKQYLIIPMYLTHFETTWYSLKKDEKGELVGLHLEKT